MIDTRLLAVTVVATLLLAGGATAAFPGSNGNLAYFWSGEIFVIEPEGSDAQSLGRGLSPAWSPSGREIAFDAVVDRNYDVWVMRADGRGRRRVTTNPAVDYGAAWSADARRIVFTSDRGGEDLYVIGRDGRGERRLTSQPGAEFGAAWSPDGRRIAFAGSSRGNLDVEAVDATGGGHAVLTDHPARDEDPAWSPDGTRIAFTSERDGNANVYVMNADGTALQRLTDHPSNDRRPAWSPDGTQIAFESDRDPAVFDRDIYVMNADGSDQRRLRTGNVNARDVDWQPTVDLTIERVVVRRTRAIVTLRNLTPVATRDVTVATYTPRRRAVRIGGLAASAARRVTIAVPRRARTITVIVSGWHADPAPRNDRVVVRR